VVETVVNLGICEVSDETECDTLDNVENEQEAAIANDEAAGDVPGSDESPASAETTRVGRWMSPSELSAMKKSGTVQYGAGGTSYVANPADPSAFGKQALPGSVYVEYDVPDASLYRAGQDGYSQIPSSSSPTGLRYMQLGNAPPDSVPVTNIDVRGTK
jgi:hypothetical protein